jgi:hypothetical protein
MIEEAQDVATKCLWTYNNERPNMAIGGITPKQKLAMIRVMPQSGVLPPESSGDQIDVCNLNTVFELYSSYHLGQVIEAT